MDKYKKEDSERAEAVLETILRALLASGALVSEHGELARWVKRELDKQVPFLMDVFVAVRGDSPYPFTK